MTVMPGKTPRPSGAWISPSMTRWWALTRVMSWPSNHTEPDVSGRRPEMARIIVVLPAPLEPSSVTSSPCVHHQRNPVQRFDSAVVHDDVAHLEQHRATVGGLRVRHRAPPGRRR